MSAQVQFSAATRFFTIATAGHVDHGKSSLLKILTGIDPDRLKEEKERQMTTDLGFAYLPFNENLVLGFVDVPGHGKFLKNMLAGVGGIDAALLVVAADEGPMPQSRQHVRILSLLGVDKAIVAITKIDLVHEQEQIELVKEEIEELLNQHHIQALAFCPLSNQTGSGIDELKAVLKAKLESLDARPEEGSLLLPVDRVFSKAGFGTVITGTLVSGTVKVGDQIFVEPGHTAARVRRLETHGQSLEQAHPGQRVACNIVMKDEEKLRRGFVLCGQEQEAARSLIVSIYDRPRILKQKLSDRLSDQPVRLYHGTAEYQGYLRWVEDLEQQSDPSGKGGQQEGIAFLALSDPAIISALDRFVIRLTDDTIYGGKILLRDRPGWLTKSEIIKLSQLLENESYEEALRLFLDDAPQLMLKENPLASILPAQLRKKLLGDCLEKGRLLRLSDYFLSDSSRKQLSENLMEALSALLRAGEESEEGVTLDLLRQKLQPKLERTAFQALVEEEAAQSKLLRKGDRVFLHSETSTAEQKPRFAEAEAKISKLLSENFALEFDEIAQQTGLDLKTVKSAVQNLVKSQELVIASYDFVASQTKIDEAHQALSDIWYAKRSIAPTDFKEKIGVTRKYAMALLQYFDDMQITRRLDSGRVLLKGPARK